MFAANIISARNYVRLVGLYFMVIVALCEQEKYTNPVVWLANCGVPQENSVLFHKFVMYCLKHEQQCFIGFKTRGVAECF